MSKKESVSKWKEKIPFILTIHPKLKLNLKDIVESQPFRRNTALFMETLREMFHCDTKAVTHGNAYEIHLDIWVSKEITKIIKQRNLTTYIEKLAYLLLNAGIRETAIENNLAEFKWKKK